MDSLQEVISTLGAEDAVDFRRFLKRTKTNANRKDLQLFNLIFESKEGETPKWSELLYGQKNHPNYQALRKRLTHSLNRFIALKLIDNDSSQASQVLNWVNMARYLASFHLNHQAWKYLLKAEKAAIANDLFEILNTVYVLQIQFLPTNKADSLNSIIEKWKQNKAHLEMNEKGEIALSLVSHQLSTGNKSDKKIDFEQLIHNTLSDLDLKEGFLLQPRFVYHLASINRKKMLRKKDFYNLEPFLVKQYNLIKDNSGFGSKYNYYHLGFLYMIAHILFRNKKFAQSQQYLNELEALLAKSSKSQQNEFYPKFVLLSANVSLFVGEVKNSINILSETLNSPKIHYSKKDELNLIVNLGIAHFQNGEPKLTQRVLASIAHSDQWCEKKMGREWVLKKALMEVILFIELEMNDLVDSRIRYVQRSFRDLFDLPVYQRVKMFVRFMKLISKNPTPDQVESIKEELEKSFTWVPFEQEDLQAVGFYAWLKGRLNNKNSYQMLLELIEQV